MSDSRIAATAPRFRVPRPLEWWFRDPSTGEIVLWQAPNATILVAQGALVVEQLDLLPEQRRLVGLIKSGALVLWALAELFRGTTPQRRLLGAIVLGFQARRFRADGLRSQT